MKQVTLRPAGGLVSLKAIIVFADLLFLALPFMIAATGQNIVIVAVTAVVSAVCIAAGTFLGRLGLDMRVEVEPDAVRIYYFWPTPVIIPRGAITGVDMMRTRNFNYVPCLRLPNNQYRMVLPFTVRSSDQAAVQIERLEQALKDVAPQDLGTQ